MDSGEGARHQRDLMGEGFLMTSEDRHRGGDAAL